MLLPKLIVELSEIRDSADLTEEQKQRRSEAARRRFRMKEKQQHNQDLLDINKQVSQFEVITIETHNT